MNGKKTKEMMCSILLYYNIQNRWDNNSLYDFAPYHIIVTAIKINLLITTAQTKLKDTCIMFPWFYDVNIDICSKIGKDLKI